MNKKLSLFSASLLISIGVVAQVRTVKGVVTGKEDGEPIIGASVVVKGTTQGVVTDMNGGFVLNNVPANAKTLVISFIGMKTQEVAIAANMNILLENDAQMLSEVTITTAYGSAKRSSLTGAISQIDQKEIERRPLSNVASALEGATSGVQVNSTYGQPGTSPSINIRGIGTINGTTSPLYVVDGVPYGGSMADLNPADIENISVLKDAASAALYGNRGANGVVLVTTKKGRAGRARFDLRINHGFYNRGIKEYEHASIPQFMEAMWQGLRNNRIIAKDAPDVAAQYATDNLIKDALYLNIFNKADNALVGTDGKLAADAQVLSGYAEDLDWFGESTRTGSRQEYTFNGSGSSEKNDYYFSVGYLKENGYMLKSDFKRLTGRMNINFQPLPWLKTGLSMNGSHQKSNFAQGDGTSSYINPFMYARNISPIYPIHLHNADGTYALDANGNIQYDLGSFTDSNGATQLTRNQFQDRHVIYETELNSDQTIRNTLEGLAYAEFLLPQNIKFSIKGNLSTRNTEERKYKNAIIGDAKGTGRSSSTIYRYKTYTVQEQLEWGRAFDKHSLSAFLGHEHYVYNYEYLYASKSKEAFAGKNYLSNFTVTDDLNQYGNNYRTESFLGRVRYAYDSRYNVEVSFRRDGTSRFHPDTRWGNFGSIGANWNMTEEQFMKAYKWVNNLKLRANYGRVANDAASGYYSYLALYTANQNGALPAYYLSQNEAPDLKWETGEAFSFALETRLFNRWNLSLEYFDKKNKDLIFSVYNPLSAGGTSTSSAVSTISKNLGTIANRGFEIETDVDVYRDKDWNINLGLNATFISNKVLKLPEQNKNGIRSSYYKILEGKSRYEFFMPTFAGVDQMTGNSMYKADLEENYMVYNGETIGKATGTDITKEVTTINGVHYVNNPTYALYEYQGSALPTVYGAFKLGIDYKAFSLSATFSYSLGGKVYDGVYSGLMGFSGTPSAFHKDIVNSWTNAPDGMTNTSPDRLWVGGTPQISTTKNSDNNTMSSRWLTSADYLIIKNISLGYELPKSIITPLGFTGVSVSASCENLFTFTSRQGMNPQQSLGGSQYNYLVTPRVFTFGLHIRL